MCSLGPHAFMAKLDLKNAYQMVPIHAEDRHLLAVKWNGVTFVDGALPFGLRSAPKIFTAVADALVWVLWCKGVERAIHCLDDFFLGPPGSEECAKYLKTALETSAELGVPVAPHKVEGPASVITFLGIVIDSGMQQLRLTSGKLSALLTALRHWYQRTSCKKRELLSLIGHLSHAAAVVVPGRTFLRHLIELSSTVCHLEHHIHLRARARSDLMWWLVFVENWNGISYLTPSQRCYSDASGSCGCGAYWQGSWFQL